ncbi:class I tRNA ligase family protein [Candidatus Peregrinibacteria bacterium]|nr:MAG: class I tRNA ligase family protein [Candidatus Peregrinibacteria bacterium]
MFKEVSPKQSFPEMEERLIETWKQNQTFEKSVKKGEKEYVFYDGPPFATGLPHYGHLLAGTIKDVVPRYYTMQGYKIERKWGWDCHGLPVENLIEKDLELKSKKTLKRLESVNSTKPVAPRF